MPVVEEWKSVKDYNTYEVSSMGRVRRDGKILRFDICNNYFRVGLYKNGNRKHKFVHRLVLETFKKNPNPTKLKLCDHINRDTLDNRISNLRWSSPTENAWNRNVRGYSFNRSKNKFVARIIVNGERKYLGSFDYSYQARRAYVAAKQKYHVFTI